MTRFGCIPFGDRSVCFIDLEEFTVDSKHAKMWGLVLSRRYVSIDLGTYMSTFFYFILIFCILCIVYYYDALNIGKIRRSQVRIFMVALLTGIWEL